ncbi:MAG: shikimate kinase [Bacteroidales bacterium]|nr:shikimate kinase [Bacteroidales bacterium]
MIVALTGFMASGKTTFGRAAAERLGWAFVDLDERITEAYGTPAALFATQGEARFREIETAVLCKTLAEAQGYTVLALGGGTVLREENLRLIKQYATLIWLDTDYDIILSELGNNDRPVLQGRTPAQIRALYDDRKPRYETAADITFPITTTDYNQVISDLAELLRTLKSPTLI